MVFSKEEVIWKINVLQFIVCFLYNVFLPDAVLISRTFLFGLSL